MSRLQDLHDVLVQIAPVHRKRILQILEEDPSLVAGFIQRLRDKLDGKTTAALRSEKKLISAFLDQLKVDRVRRRIKKDV